MMKITENLDEALHCLKEGKILAYPTEAIYGLGCDPFNQKAVERLLLLKQRTVDKGLILLIADWHQLSPLIEALPDAALEVLHETWPGPVTWIFPKSAAIPSSVSGINDTIAIRMTSHGLARSLCLNGPIISTSANLSGQVPAHDLASLCGQFPNGVDLFLQGPLGGLNQPSEIYDIVSRKRFR